MTVEDPSPGFRYLRDSVDVRNALAGKLLAPKTGFLRSIVQAVNDGDVPDAIVVPISLSYDRVVEGSAMTAELAGGQKKAEALLGVVSGVYRLIRDAATNKLCFGRVDIGVAEPISVRKFLQERNSARDVPAPTAPKSPKKSVRIGTVSYAAEIVDDSGAATTSGSGPSTTDTADEAVDAGKAERRGESDAADEEAEDADADDAATADTVDGEAPASADDTAAAKLLNKRSALKRTASLSRPRDMFAGSRSDIDRDARLLGYASLWHWCGARERSLRVCLLTRAGGAQQSARRHSADVARWHCAAHAVRARHSDRRARATRQLAAPRGAVARLSRRVAEQRDAGRLDWHGD